MAEESGGLVEACREFARSMARAEEAFGEAGTSLSPASLAQAFQEVLGWLQTTDELPPNSLTRELAREILAHLSSVVALQGFKGSPQAYIA